MNRRKNFRKGIVDGIPICLGYFSVAFAFGIFAVGKGLTPWEAMLLSMSCVTSAGQLAAVPIIGASGSLLELAISQLVINIRYTLMSISLSQKLSDDVTLPHRFAISFVNTDEVFAVASAQKGTVGKWYLYGLIAPPWLGWSGGTIVGALVGDILPDIVTTSLGVAIYGMFIAIILPEMKQSKPTALCVGIAIALSCLCYYAPVLNAIPSGFAIILCACIASAVMAIAAPIATEVTERA